MAMKVQSQIGGKQKKNGKLVDASKTSGEQAEWHRLQQKNLNMLDLPSDQLAKTALAYLKKKNRAICPNNQIVGWERVKMSESQTLARERIEAGAWEEKDGFHSKGRNVPYRRERESKSSVSERSRRKHERVSGRKSSPGNSRGSCFNFKSGHI